MRPPARGRLSILVVNIAGVLVILFFLGWSCTACICCCMEDSRFPPTIKRAHSLGLAVRGAWRTMFLPQ